MYYDQQVPSASALLRPLNIDVDTLAQPDSHPRHQGCDQGVGTFQVPVPGGGSIWLNDPAGTSMSLNLGIDPSSGTPILSGRAISAQGDVLDVHPCSCSDPVSPYHKLPRLGSPEPTRGRQYARDHSHLYPSPRSLVGVHRRPAPIQTWTPLIVVQPQLPQSPSGIELQQNAGTPAPETHAEALRSPFTPTPVSLQRQSLSPSTQDSFHSPSTCPEDTLAPQAAPIPPESRGGARSPLSHVPPRLDTIPEQSTFDIDFDTPLVQSPSSIGGPSSEISAPSTLGPLPSLPGSPSNSASEYSTRTVMPPRRPVLDVQQDRAITEPTVNRPSSGGGNGSTTTDAALPGHADGPVNVGAAGTPAHGATAATIDAVEPANPPQRYASWISDLYTDRDVADSPTMPTARITADGPELRYDLTTGLQPVFMTEDANPSEAHSGNVTGTWAANMRQDKMKLKLDLSLDGLGLQNLSLSVPNPRSPSHPGAGLVVRPVHALCVPDEFDVVPCGNEWRWEVKSNSSQSVVTLGSCPSTAPPLSDLPLTPIPELLHTPTSVARPSLPSSRASAQPAEQQHLLALLPSPLDSGPILAQLAVGEKDTSTIRNALANLANEWRRVVMMPDGVALRDVEDDCAALYHALVDLAPIITLTWPPTRQPSLGTEGGQPPALEQQFQLQNMGEAERKWYLKQHEFTTSLQRNLTRLALLAQRVREDPDAAYRGNILERISQFTAKFEDITLRLKLAYHIRVEQKYRVRVRHSARCAVPSPEQAAAHEYQKARLAKVREDIEEIKRALHAAGGPRPLPPW
ncbi:hypothetical protein BJV78DRAFT_1191352 [Lactifluus subvellereus]|nr:hypothetical protein BJV78DRAFT_1191352 [Lactifluus subvellereus]